MNVINEIIAQVSLKYPELDEVAAFYAEIALRFAEKLCDRQFEQATFTEEHKAFRSVVVLRNYPVTSVVSVTSLDDTIAYSVKQFTRGGIVFLDGWVNDEWVKVTYTAGFTTLPADLLNALVELTAFFCKRETNIATLRSGDFTVNFNDIPADIKETLYRYRSGW
ncbi:MAG: hypothetical protein QXY94_06860 [Archaeoglobaceae archaeon]